MIVSHQTKMDEMSRALEIEAETLTKAGNRTGAKTLLAASRLPGSSLARLYDILMAVRS